MLHKDSMLVALAIAVFLVEGAASQSAKPSPLHIQALTRALQPLVSGEWHPFERDGAWLQLRRELNDELTQRPHGELAALVRRAAARVDVEMTPVIARRNEELSVHVDTRPRFVLGVPIPYAVDVYASLDGGEWSRVGTFRDGRECGTRVTSTTLWPPALKEGLHRLDLRADVLFLAASRRPPDESDCGFLRRDPNQRSRAQRVEQVIRHERRALSTQLFVVTADLGGGPATLASTLETGLPPVPIGQWLNGLLASTAGATPRPAGSWVGGWCAPEETYVFSVGGWHKAPPLRKRGPRAICVTFLAGLGDDRLLSLQLRVGTLDVRAGIWSIEPPSIREMAIGGSGRVMDVPFLGMLSDLMSFTAASLPAVDVSIQPGDIRYEPPDARPGDPVTIIATIRNLGERDAPSWNGMLSVISESTVLLRDFAGEVPAQGHMVVSFPTPLPVWACVAVTIDPMPATALMRQGPYGQILDVNLDNSTASIAIGASPPKTLDHCAR